MMTKLIPSYTTSHALIIGVNNYRTAPPLGYAVNDAEAVAALMREDFGFAEENVHVLLNEDANRASILSAFMAFTQGGTEVNDRLLVFFAGHGHTVRARRRDVGFLVPWDGNQNDLGSLIRWDDLTRNAELIEAKHILFLMDACYGGLALQRALQAGSTRFLQDMTLRYARQVLTAGKANETVADLGGPLPDHSIFTGHLVEGLKGKAATNGVITANGLMYYVYRSVGRDAESQQTPHYGWIDGDGDLVFVAPEAADAGDIEQPHGSGADLLITVPSVFVEEEQVTVVGKVKEYLSEERFRIKLFEAVAAETRRVVAATDVTAFRTDVGWSNEEFAGRLNRYEDITADLLAIQALLGYWGAGSNRKVLTMPASKLCQGIQGHGGTRQWHDLRWYPSLLMMYAAGVAAVAAGRYENLEAVLDEPVEKPGSPAKEVALVRALVLGLDNLPEAFKTLPGHERHRTARSEYIFKLLQPQLDDLFFLGPTYEAAFDEFEVLLALEHAWLYRETRVWGPIGRFGWKRLVGDGDDPLGKVLAAAKTYRDAWPPLKARLFGGSYDKFIEIAIEYQKFVDGQWH